MTVMVLSCGTNNIGNNDNEYIVKKGIKVLLTSILPRDLYPSQTRSNIDKINLRLKVNADYIECGEGWTDGSGILYCDFFYKDFLHLSEAGNDKFAYLISKGLEKLLSSSESGYEDPRKHRTRLDLFPGRYIIGRKKKCKVVRKRYQSPPSSED